MDIEALSSKHLTGITVGFYATGKPGKAPASPEFSLNIGQVKVGSVLPVVPLYRKVRGGEKCQSFIISHILR